MNIGKRAVVLVLAMSIAVNSYAWLALLAPVSTGVMWLGRIAAANVSAARAVEWSLMAHGALFSFIAWKNASDTTVESVAPMKARLVVQPNVTAKRDNPDPTKWDDPAATRSPTPKTSFQALGSSDYPSQQQPWASIVANAMNGPYDTYSSSTGTVYKKTYQCMTTNVRPDLSLTNGSYTWSTEGTGTYNAATVYCFSKPTTTVTVTCPSGYAQSGTWPTMTCNLTAAPATVQKPAGKTPCEVLQNSDGSWDIDAQNPECANLATALTKSNGGKTLTYAKGDGTYDNITSNPDGTRTIQTGNRTITVGPPGSDGNSTIQGITDNGPGTGGTSGSGTGTGTGTGTGSAVCGAAPLPACAVTVDDSAFNGKDTAINAGADAAKAKLDDRQAAITAAGNGSDSFGLDTSWIPSVMPGAAVQCAALKWEPGINHGPLAGLSGSMDIDYCSNIDVFRQYYAWMFGVITAIAIALLFFASNGNTGKGGR